MMLKFPIGHGDGSLKFSEVQYYFKLDLNDIKGTAFAMVSLYSPPNNQILEKSQGALYACKYNGRDSFNVVKVTTIQAVVAMPPLPLKPDEDLETYKDSHFVAEKLFLEMMELGKTYQRPPKTLTSEQVNVIAAADHSTLLYCQNEAHTKLYKAYMQLRDENLANHTFRQTVEPLLPMLGNRSQAPSTPAMAKENIPGSITHATSAAAILANNDLVLKWIFPNTYGQPHVQLQMNDIQFENIKYWKREDFNAKLEPILTRRSLLVDAKKQAKMRPIDQGTLKN
ncbi:hypothetical protein AX16_010897 [Volvariella volvacea WC 439]|nr:hypothetical protein AX16_010897 [Volvariella volvacea WC 439]